MATLKEAIRETIADQDAMRAGKIADRLRRMGMNYNQSFDVIKKCAPNTELADWDALLYEADETESKNHRNGTTIYNW